MHVALFLAEDKDRLAHQAQRALHKLGGAGLMGAWRPRLSTPAPNALTPSLPSFPRVQAARQIQAVQDLAQAADAGQCQIPGKVDDLSDCTYSAVHSLNHRHVNPVVRELVRTAFFRYFKASGKWGCTRCLAGGLVQPPVPPPGSQPSNSLGQLERVQLGRALDTWPWVLPIKQHTAESDLSCMTHANPAWCPCSPVGMLLGSCPGCRACTGQHLLRLPAVAGRQHVLQQGLQCVRVWGQRGASALAGSRGQGLQGNTEPRLRHRRM